MPWRTAQQSNNKWKQGGGWASNARGQGKWWTCTDRNCCDALKKAGRTPWQNKPAATACDICGVHWDQGQQKQAEELALLKKEVRAAAAANNGSRTTAGAASLVVEQKTSAWERGDDTEDSEMNASTTLALPQEYSSIAKLL